MHVTLVGFLRGRRFLVYSGNDRIVAAADSTDEDLAGRSER
jgi:hypothetical protein